MPQPQIPSSMAVVEISEPGPPEVLVGARRPVPQANSDEVLIKVSGAGVNRPDCLQRRGIYPAPPGASDLPGLEVSGQVVAVGSSVSNWQIHDEVCALIAGGGYAEYCAAPAAQCLPVPKNMELIHAAALPETFFTVWSNLFDRAQLKKGESVLIHGGASGIGTTAIQMARATGARVYATAGSDEKCALCKTLGAEHAINYRQENFTLAMKELTDAQGVDVVLDIVGGAYLDDNLKVLATDGRLAIIGVLGGGKGEANLGRMLTKRLTITASTLRARDQQAKSAIAEQLRQHIWPKLDAGEIKPVIQKIIPLRDAADAHRLLEANEARGKIVLSCD